MAPVVEVDAVTKDHRRGQRAVRALHDVSITIGAGEAVGVTGPSGSGKSTLLHLMGGLDHPTAGRVVVDGTDLGRLSDGALTDFRRRRLGFVFQFFNLLPTLTAWENVAVPRLLGGARLRHERRQAVTLLERVGLGDRVDHRPAELSGGELQRVAVARALVNDPVLVLADEPTGNLDSASGALVLDLLRSLTTGEGRTLVVVTHDADVGRRVDRAVSLVDGRVADREPVWSRSA